jgi:hypothetical protein
LRDFNTDERRKGIEQLIDKYSQQFNGVHIIFIDGIADIIDDTNDQAQSNDVVRFFERIAIKYNCPVITIIHLNPGSTEKSRGHLGSQLERKCESVVSISKDKDSEVSTIEGKLLRNAGAIPQLQFKYDIEKGYHVACGVRMKPSKAEAQEKELREYAEAIFQDGIVKLTYTELVNQLIIALSVSDRTAKSKISLMKEVNIIEHEGDKLSKLVLVKK